MQNWVWDTPDPYGGVRKAGTPVSPTGSPVPAGNRRTGRQAQSQAQAMI